ncbi:hypothetical protein GALMADRAFT_158645, partial [Galerina marginata CBS 339.88]
MGALTTNINNLPDELYEKILAYCSNYDLYRVSLTSRRLSSVSSRILYRVIPKMDVARTIDFLIAVCFYKDRAPYVWSLTIQFSKVSLSKSLSKREAFRRLRKLGNPLKAITLRSVLRDYATLLTTALKNLTNLRYLELRLMEPDGRDNNVARLLGPTTFQLKTFITTLEFSSAMGRFLQTQTQLRELQCPTSLTAAIRDKNLLPPPSLPNLNVIGWTSKVPMDAIRYIVNGRPIDRIIVLIEATSTHIKPFIDVGPRSESIRKIFITFHSLQVTTAHMSEIAAQFPAMYELAMKVKEMSKEFMDVVVGSIHRFKSLKRLAVTGRRPFTEDLQTVYQPHFDACFSNSLSLVFIAIPVIKNNLTVYHIIR